MLLAILTQQMQPIPLLEILVFGHQMQAQLKVIKDNLTTLASRLLDYQERGYLQCNHYRAREIMAQALLRGRMFLLAPVLASWSSQPSMAGVAGKRVRMEVLFLICKLVSP